MTEGTKTCTHCDGTGKTEVYACPGFRRMETKCLSCGGSGAVTPEMTGWKVAGEAMRRARIDRRESLRDTATRLGIDIARYSRIEFGLEPLPEAAA